MVYSLLLINHHGTQIAVIVVHFKLEKHNLTGFSGSQSYTEKLSYCFMSEKGTIVFCGLKGTREISNFFILFNFAEK